MCTADPQPAQRTRGGVWPLDSDGEAGGDEPPPDLVAGREPEEGWRRYRGTQTVRGRGEMMSPLYQSTNKTNQPQCCILLF